MNLPLSMCNNKNSSLFEEDNFFRSFLKIIVAMLC